MNNNHEQLSRWIEQTPISTLKELEQTIKQINNIDYDSSEQSQEQSQEAHQNKQTGTRDRTDGGQEEQSRSATQHVSIHRPDQDHNGGDASSV